MKKLLLFFALLPVALFSQIEKGDIMTGGNIDLHFASAKYTTYRQSKFSAAINPGVSGFLTKHIALGGNLTYFVNTVKSTVGNTTSNQLSCGFLIGPQLREYFKITNNLYFFGHHGVNFGVGRKLYSNDKTQPFDRDIIIQFKVGPGLAFQLKKHLLIEAGVFYRADLIKSQLVQKTTVLSSSPFNVTHNVLFNLGCNILLNKKAKK